MRNPVKVVKENGLLKIVLEFDALSRNTSTVSPA